MVLTLITVVSAVYIHLDEPTIYPSSYPADEPTIYPSLYPADEPTIYISNFRLKIVSYKCIVYLILGYAIT